MTNPINTNQNRIFSTPPPPNTPVKSLSLSLSVSSSTSDTCNVKYEYYKVDFKCDACKESHLMTYRTDGSLASYKMIDIDGNKECPFVSSVIKSLGERILMDSKK